MREPPLELAAGGDCPSHRAQFGRGTVSSTALLLVTLARSVMGLSWFRLGFFLVAGIVLVFWI